jgi:hypothetical protein
MWSASDQMFCEVSAKAAVPSARAPRATSPRRRAGWLARTVPSRSQKTARFQAEFSMHHGDGRA